jgi:hypothetical protein
VGEPADLEGGCGGATTEEAAAAGEGRQPREVGAIRVGGEGWGSGYKYTPRILGWWAEMGRGWPICCWQWPHSPFAESHVDRLSVKEPNIFIKFNLK